MAKEDKRKRGSSLTRRAKANKTPKMPKAKNSTPFVKKPTPSGAVRYGEDNTENFGKGNSKSSTYGAYGTRSGGATRVGGPTKRRTLGNSSVVPKKYW